MKRLGLIVVILFILAFFVLLISSCNKSEKKVSKEIDPYYIENKIIKGHDYILYKYWTGRVKGQCIVHDPDCKKCLDLYD